MAQFPRRESDVLALANAMVDGYTAHPGDFPNADLATLTSVRHDYKHARTTHVCLTAVAKALTDEKDARLDALAELMRVQLEQSEVDTAGNPDALRLIGWGPEAPGQPSCPPGQPRALEAVDQGPGTLVLDWKPPAPGPVGPVRTYVVERREQRVGGGAFSAWQQVGASLSTQAHLTNQPQRQQLEYRLIAVNPAGEGTPSNTVAVVL